ncbi:hypothetical protein GQF00_14625 [Alcanivorax sp. DP30]|nr:hypothetical protein [Alcanivorax sp. DP30]
MKKKKEPAVTQHNGLTNTLMLCRSLLTSENRQQAGSCGSITSVRHVIVRMHMLPAGERFHYPLNLLMIKKNSLVLAFFRGACDYSILSGVAFSGAGDIPRYVCSLL